MFTYICCFKNENISYIQILSHYTVCTILNTTYLAYRKGKNMEGTLKAVMAIKRAWVYLK